MKDIEKDDERLYHLIQKQKLHQAEMSMKKSTEVSADDITEAVIKKYEEFLNHEQLLADLVEKWGPILDGEPDK